ncbi:hypothetical protein PRIEUP_LOCUS16319 [Pristimantis euphronides]
MDEAEEKFMDYLRDNLGRLESLKVNELIFHLTGCLSMTTVEKLEAYVRNQGNRPSVLSFYLELSRCDDWVPHFICALKKCGHTKLAKEFEQVYSSYVLQTSEWAIVQARPILRNPRRHSSLPQQTPPTSLNAQPGPSQSFNQIQPEQETSRRSPSEPNHDFRNLPPSRPDPPAAPRTPLSHNAFAPGAPTLEGDKFTNPVPETSPYQTAPSEGDVTSLERDESSISENPPIGHDPLPSRSLSPSLKLPQSEVSIQPSSEDGSPMNVPETQTAPSISGERGADNWRGQPVSDKTEKLQEQDAAYRTVTPGQKDHGGKEQREQPVTHKVDNVPDNHPVRSHPANRDTPEEEPRSEGAANQPVLSGSSCRPLDNSNDCDEDYVSKPGVLVNTVEFGDVTVVAGASSVLSHSPQLEISDFTERTESSNVSDRSSPTSTTQDKLPPVSTPNSRSTQTEDRRSPEENDNFFDSSCSPQPPPSLLHSSSKQPEENSFVSTGVSHYRLDFNESPEEDLLEDNEDVLRSRPKKIPSTDEPKYQTTQQKYRKEAEGRDRERTVLITITVASVCLSLYLLWKMRQN